MINKKSQIIPIPLFIGRSIGSLDDEGIDRLNSIFIAMFILCLIVVVGYWINMGQIITDPFYDLPDYQILPLPFILSLLTIYMILSIVIIFGVSGWIYDLFYEKKR